MFLRAIARVTCHPSAEGVVESLFEQLRIAGHVSPSRRYKIDGQDLRQLALDVNTEPNITKIVTNSSGEKNSRNFGYPIYS